MAYIVPEGGGPVEIPSSPDELTIGRAEDCSIQIEDAKSSRHHCAVFEEAGSYTVRDNDSRNGTLVNGEAIRVHALSEGDVISIGKTRLFFRLSVETDLEDVGGEAPAAEEKWILVRMGEAGEEDVHELGERITIGRKPTNTIQVRDTKASGVNTEIVADGSGYTVRDLNSTNGTRVDGKLVTEPVGLYHGSVVTVGKTDFVIKNTAIPDIGDPGFESQALGGEDFTTFARRRRRRLPVGLLFLVLAALGGLVGFRYLAEQTVTRERRTLSPQGNLLTENYSFEEGTDADGFPLGYTALLGPNDSTAVATGGAPTGRACLELSKGEGNSPDAEAEVLYSAPLDVSSEALYELSASIRPSGVRGVAGLRITWLKKKDPLYRRVSTSRLLSGDGDWETVTLRAMPPENVTGLEVSLFFTGSEGSVLCDDMALFKRPGEPVGTVLEATRLHMTFDNHGVFSVRPEKLLKDLVWNGQVVIIGREGKSKSQQMFSTLDEGFPKVEEKRVEIRGRIYEFLSRTWVPFRQVAVVEEGELRVRYEVDPPPGTVDLAGLVFSPDQRKIAQGVGIATSDSYARVTGTFERDGVQRMIWGSGGGRLSLNYDPPVTCLQKREAKELVFLQIVPPDDEGVFRFSVHFQTDFSEAATTVVDLLDRAETHRSEGRLGRAVETYQTIVTRYPFHRDAKVAGKAVSDIEAAAAEARDRVRARFENARFFQDLGEMRVLRDEVKALLERFRGSSVTAELESLSGEVARAHQDLKINLGRQKVEGLLLRARDYLDREEKHLARALLSYVASEYEGTEWADDAAELLGTLQDQ